MNFEYEGITIYRNQAKDVNTGEIFPAIFIFVNWRTYDDYIGYDEHFFVKTDNSVLHFIGEEEETDSHFERIYDYYEQTGLSKPDDERKKDFFCSTYDYEHGEMVNSDEMLEEFLKDLQLNFDVWYERASRLYSTF